MNSRIYNMSIRTSLVIRLGSIWSHNYLDFSQMTSILVLFTQKTGFFSCQALTMVKKTACSNYFRICQATANEGKRTIIHFLLILMSITTEIGVMNVTIMLLLRLLAKDSSWKFYEEYPNILCTFMVSR
jgi:hypothetical protein